MNFYLTKTSTDPILKMRLVENGQNNRDEFYERLESSTITFSMTDSTGNYKIFKKAAGIISKDLTSENNSDTYYIYYKWQDEDVDTKGIFLGYFEIKFFSGDSTLDSKMIVPIKEPLYINII